ncbi:MAG TPA: ABC transporter ATP-binding protein [bacterium]|nr:ABC transporter ATP-binding protein [bacterium]
MTPTLQVAGLGKRFRHQGGWLDVLQNVSLTVSRHQFVSLLGPSGCGKSTLCNIVAGLFPPDEGTILLDGAPLGPERGRVAYMQQKDLLLPWRTVIDNAILGMEIQGVPRPTARAEARQMLQRFGLEGFERTYPALLSGGMRQRVALVRTLLCKRDLLVLDEPFGALDAMTRSAMQGYLLRLQAEFGRTVLFITHDVEEAVLLSDRIYVLTARPGRNRAEVTIDLPRPRYPTSEGVVREKAHLLGLLQAEMAEAFA